jgi:hypothetical protein
MGGSSANRRKTRGRQTAQAAGILVVNMIPKALSGEAEQDSEPSLAVNPADPSQIVASAFTPDPLGGNLAPIFVSNDGGQTWTLRSTVPSNGITGDISIDFGGNGRLYGGILKLPGNLLLNLLRTANSFGTTPMTILSSRNRVDQPFVRSIPVNGRDRVYIGNNDFGQANGRTATIDVSLHGAAPTPQFTLVRIEHRSTGSAGQNGPQIRPAVHADGTVYAAFYGWRSVSPVTERITSDVIVVRDDGVTGPQSFTALVDPSDNLPGRIVASGSRIVFGRLMGNQRTGGDLSIATDPRDSQIVYVAWASIDPVTDYTLHVRRSADGGATWSANDLRTKARATNPALAINSAGKVCFLCQQLKGNGASARWVTTVERSEDDGVTWTSNTLATVPANAPSPQFQPYIGDYVGLTSVKKDFYGIFSANNSPDLARFPSGVVYQREHDFQTRRLFGVDGTTQVSISIDPFFFKITE